MDTTREEHFKRRYPGLRDGSFQITSDATPDYNCIAWAGGENSRKWYPDPWDIYHWPSESRNDTLGGWIEAFVQLGYQPCADGELEQGYEKVVIYGMQGVPQHVALQLTSGLWTSKLGNSEDIEHEVAGLAGADYGNPLVYLRRVRPT